MKYFFNTEKMKMLLNAQTKDLDEKKWKKKERI